MLASMGERTMAWACVAAVVVVVGLVPLALDRDSYPLSTYPMFSNRRSTAESVDTAVLIRDGKLRRLSPSLIADTDEVILAAATVKRAIAAGTAATLCTEIAERVGGRGEIEVVTERFDSVRWYEGDKEPLSRTVHARCPSGGAA
jgi:hypothetical protein